MPSERTVVIDSFPDSVVRYATGYAVVCVKVLNTSTTLVSAVARGRAVYAARSVTEARDIRSGLGRATLVGEDEGSPIEDFDLLDSPFAVEQQRASDPIVLFSNPVSELLANARALNVPTYVACLRNVTATASALTDAHDRIAIVGAGYHSEFSCEDQMACARLAFRLLAAGFEPGDLRTLEVVRRWNRPDPELLSLGNSAAGLRRRGRMEDVEFALEHVDDSPLVVRLEDGRSAVGLEYGDAKVADPRLGRDERVNRARALLRARDDARTVSSMNATRERDRE